MGVLLAATQVTLATGSNMEGRILSQTGVALQKSTVMQPRDVDDCNLATTTTVTAIASCGSAQTETLLC